MTAVTGERAPAARAARSYFFVWMAVACLVVAFVGFAPTYWLPLFSGRFTASPRVHIHGAVFFTWTLFLVWQTWLVANGRTAHHRETGLIGVSLATAMLILGFITGLRAVAPAIGTQYEFAAKQFLIVPLSGIVLFAILVAAAIVNVKHSDWHKRLLLVATISILEAPIARWFLTFLAPPPPAEGPRPPPPIEVTTGPAIVASLIILVAIIYDWRTRGRPHPAYLWAGGEVLVKEIVRVPLSSTPLWIGTADALLTLVR
jgi:hypothetical protein